MPLAVTMGRARCCACQSESETLRSIIQEKTPALALQIWHTATGELRHSLTLGANDMICSLAFRVPPLRSVPANSHSGADAAADADARQPTAQEWAWLRTRS